MAELIDREEALEQIKSIPYATQEEVFFMSVAVSRMRKMPTTTEAEIRNKAISEFAEKLKWELGQLIFTDSEKFAYPVKGQEQICHQNMTLKRAIRLVDYFAEQLKEG